MTRLQDPTDLDLMLELVAERGPDAMASVFTTLLNLAMKVERQKVLGVEPFERSPARTGQANGFKPKTIDTRVGRLDLRVPQTRDVEFYPTALERGTRSDRALKAAIAEMYVKGISTRKVAAVMKKLCGFEVSSTQVSRAAAELDEELEKWRTRPLSNVTYLILDARYEKVRQDGSVLDCAILTAVGVTPDGQRTILGTSCHLSEAEVHWRDFLDSLVKRGLRSVQFIVSDDHAGLGAARQAIFASVPWQRCQFHLAQNAMAHVPAVSMRTDVAADIRSIFNAHDRPDAERHLRRVVEKYAESAPKLATWVEENVPEGLTVFELPAARRRKLRTTNGLERIHREIKRRTRVVGLFPNEASVERLISAVLMEIDEDWTTGRKYLTMEDAE